MDTGKLIQEVETVELIRKLKNYGSCLISILQDVRDGKEKIFLTEISHHAKSIEMIFSLVEHLEEGPEVI